MQVRVNGAGMSVPVNMNGGGADACECRWRTVMRVDASGVEDKGHYKVRATPR